MFLKHTVAALLLTAAVAAAGAAAEVRGIVSKVDPERKELLIELRGRGRGTILSFVLGDGSRVLFGQQAGGLGDLAPGQRVRVEYDLRDGRQVVVAVYLNGGRPAPAPVVVPRGGDNALTGTLQRVALTDREIVVVGRGPGGAPAETTVSVPETAKISRADQAIKLDDLKEGERVAVQVEKRDGKAVAVSVQVLGPEVSRLSRVRGILKTIDEILEMMEQRRGMKP
jgi:hypothetical protein